MPGRDIRNLYEITENPSLLAGYLASLNREETNTNNAIQQEISNFTGQSFNYQLSESVSSSDIGKLMMQVWEGEGDLNRAAVYQEDHGALSDFFFMFDYQITSSQYIEFYIQSRSGYQSAQIVEGVDFTRNADLDIQFASILAGVLANSSLSDLYTVVSYPTGGTRAIRFTAKIEGWGWGNGTIQVGAGNLQDGAIGGPFKLPLGKLLEISGDGYGVIAPFTGQSFIADGSISKNSYVVGTNNGKVKERTGDWYQDAVVGLAKSSVSTGTEVTLNYCPRTPEIWLNDFEERLPTTPQEALDMYMWYWWD